MLKLRDFFHLPQVDRLVEQLVTDGPGLRIVAGLDPRSVSPQSAPVSLLPGGRSAIFGILLNEMLAVHPDARCVIVAADDDFIRIPRKKRNLIQLSLVDDRRSYRDSLAEAMEQRPDLIVVDHLGEENVSAALLAARQGLRVLTQLDTIFRGPAVARQLLDLGAEPEALEGLAWVLTLQRMPTLCERCKQPALPDPEQIERLQRYYPSLTSFLNRGFDLRSGSKKAPPNGLGFIASPPLGEAPGVVKGEIGAYFSAGSCEQCHHTGRDGEISVFDFFRAEPPAASISQQASLLPMELYVLYLASLGRLALEDFLQFEDDQVRKALNLFMSSERSLTAAKAAAERRLVQMEAAHRVLTQRTEAIISFQELSQALITSAGLDELAERVCHRAHGLCGADRVVLYYQHAGGEVEILAVRGWDAGLRRKQVPAELVFGTEMGNEPLPYNRRPPGVPPRIPETESLQTGLLVPLVAQEQRVGLMVVHSTQKPRFTQGEIALLRAFANQAALAIQRAGLVDQLTGKIQQLEAAQAELVKKERLEREMELARQVQQNLLPRRFPQAARFRFAAQNEPARQVGGDFYDVIDLGSGTYGIAIADVSDKGMPAALYMALTRSLLRAEARRDASPARVLANINRLLLELGEPNMFVTVFYALLDEHMQRMVYARAGHERPVLLRDGQAHELEGQGIALGVVEPGEFFLSEEHIDLRAGDCLVLYTDGLADILSGEGQAYGRNRLVDFLKAHSHRSPEALCEAVFAHLASFRGQASPYDDMTLLVAAVH